MEAAAIGPKNGGTAPDEPIKSDCKELAAANDARRDELDDKTVDKTLVGAEGEGEGTTISSVKPGDGAIRSAHNNHKAYEKCKDNLTKGGSEAVRSGSATTLCGNYTHARPTMQKSGHAEARLMDSLGDATSIKMTLNIDWRPKTGAPSKMPCPACHNMMCKAMEKKPGCGHQISLCRDEKKGDPAKVELSDRHCPSTPESYARLEQDMGED